jgi:hypothetical protein
MGATVPEVVQLVLVGLLAGEELVVRVGVQPAMDRLPDDAHVRTRIAMVQRLKVVVPLLMLPTVLVSVALLVVRAGADDVAWRVAGCAALVAFLLFSFLGTVPINMKVNDWDPEHPPADWRRVAGRWERIDTFRSSAAVLAFVLFAVALGVRLPM